MKNTKVSKSSISSYCSETLETSWIDSKCHKKWTTKLCEKAVYSIIDITTFRAMGCQNKRKHFYTDFILLRTKMKSNKNNPWKSNIIKSF